MLSEQSQADIVEPMASELVRQDALKAAWRDGFDAGTMSSLRGCVNPYVVGDKTPQRFQLERAWNQGYAQGKGFPAWPGDDEEEDVSSALDTMAGVAWQQAVIGQGG